MIAVLGNNGAGKSTLLRALSGTLAEHNGAITCGTIEFAGRALAARRCRRDRALRPGPGPRGPQGLRQPHRGGEPSRRWPGGAGQAAARAHARAWVDELFPILGERASQRAGLLSGGEQQMLAIGRALMASPKRAAARRAVAWAWRRRSSSASARSSARSTPAASPSCWSSRTRRWRSRVADRRRGARGRAGRARGHRRRTGRERCGARALPRRDHGRPGEAARRASRAPRATLEVERSVACASAASRRSRTCPSRSSRARCTR